MKPTRAQLVALASATPCHDDPGRGLIMLRRKPTAVALARGGWVTDLKLYTRFAMCEITDAGRAALATAGKDLS